MPITFDETIDRLEKAGLEVDRYRRGPDGASVFSAAVHHGKIRLFPGVAELECVTDRKLRQAVLTVAEKKRSVSHSYEVRHYLSRSGLTVDDVTADQQVAIRRTAESQFPVRMPRGRFSGFKILSLDEVVGSLVRGEYIVVVQLTCTAPKSTSHFLMGRDETSQFISLLPEAARSVEEAHRVLRPKGLRSKSVRQGEWFFEPVSAHMAEELDEAFFEARSLSHANVYRTFVSTGVQIPESAVPTQLEPFSSHEALVLTHETRRYARGWVRDRRKGHHEPLWLAGWHRIVRNRERTVAPSPAMQTGRFD